MRISNLLAAVCLCTCASLASAQTDEYIIDNLDAEVTGSWSSSTYNPNYYQSDYLFSNSGSGSSEVIWRPTLTQGGTYEVYYRLPDGDYTRPTDGHFTVHYDGGSYQYFVNQEVAPGGNWILLGAHTFTAGTTGYVSLDNSGNGQFVVADAIRFTRISPEAGNLALNKSVTVDSSYGSYTGAKAVDGEISDASRWLSANTSGPHWLAVDLQRSETLSCAHVYNGFENEPGVVDFELQYFSGGNWAVIPGATVTENDTGALRIEFSTPVTASQVRLYSTDNQYVKIKELQLFASAPCPQLETPDTPPAIYLNQSGFNLNESKRFTAPTLADGTSFTIRKASGSALLYSGTVNNNIGDFSSFNPQDTGDYVIESGGITSVPFGIGPYWYERVSYQPAMDFMIQSRCYVGTDNSCVNAVAWRDAHQFAFEIPTLVAQYFSNPDAYARMPAQVTYVSGYGALNPPAANAPDIVKLIHWGIDRYYAADINHTLFKEQLAYFLYAYPQLSDYISASDYQTILDFTFNQWGNTERDRYNWYDVSHTADLFQTYTIIGSGKGNFPPGHSIMPNLLMYQVALREGRSDAQDYLDAAYNQADWLINNLDWSDPATTKGQRMSEHVTLEGLVYFLRHFPSSAPPGLYAKIESWAYVMIGRSQNMWDFRKYDDNDGWVIPDYNEPGNVAGFPAAAYAAVQVLTDPVLANQLRLIAVAQLDNIYGRNPTGRHFSFDGPDDFEGVEFGWYSEYQGGAGRLQSVVGVLDGAPKPQHYPYFPNTGNPGWTEGWVNFNTAWNSSLAYSAYDKTRVTVFDSGFSSPLSAFNPGDTLGIELTAPLNFDYDTAETATVRIATSNGDSELLHLTETGVNGLVFRGAVATASGSANTGDGIIQLNDSGSLEVSYGLEYFKRSAVYSAASAGNYVEE